MGTQHNRLPLDNQGLGPTRPLRPVRLQKEALGPLGASWAGGGVRGAGECWLGSAPSSGTTTGHGPGLPRPPRSCLPSCLTQESLVFVAPEPSAHLPLTSAVVGVALVLISVIPANPLPASPCQPPTSEAHFLLPGLGAGKHAG
ncbi:unnamed protein product [Rangifer tarandus platyrhynchus]|uniref:Uncharacterized protein n=1 Tax=Rangifer tarandus platyrhynchus TaxID=3082113 RepID=A0AC59ZWB4_RANTA